MAAPSQWQLPQSQEVARALGGRLAWCGAARALGDAPVRAAYASAASVYLLAGAAVHRLATFGRASGLARVAAVPGLRAVNSPCLFALGDEVFLFSGISTASRLTVAQMLAVRAPARVRRFAGALPPSRAGAACCEFNGRAFLLGGLHSAATEERLCADVWTFDGAAWRELAVRGPGPECVHASCRVVCDRILVFGGYSGHGARGMLYNDLAWLLDPVSGQIKRAKLAVGQDALASQRFALRGLCLLVGDEEADISELFAMEI